MSDEIQSTGSIKSSLNDGDRQATRVTHIVFPGS